MPCLDFWKKLAIAVVLGSATVVSGDDSAAKKPSPKDLARLRILQFKANAQDRASGKAGVVTLSGPVLSEREKVLQVLNRMAFGPRPGQVEAILKEYGGWEKWAKEQIDPAKIDDADLDKLLAKQFPWTGMPLMEIKEKYPIGERDDDYGNRQLQRELPEAVVVRAALSNRQFKEVMCEFWRNHFFVNQPDANAPMRAWTACDYEDQVIRKHAFGKFRDLLAATTTHPAMLEYLDNWISKKNAWNENYARELMELHTVGADKGYTETDVLELAKVFTGWTFDREKLEFTFKEDWHQPGSKKWLGTTVPQGPQGGVMVLDTLAASKACADFISFKLCRYLVNDKPPPALVAKVSRVFRETKGDLPKVYWAILSSPEFMSRDNYRAKFKTPFEFTVSALRVTDAQIADAHETCQVLRKMGQAIYNCDDPTGYFDQAEAWMDSGVLTSRWDYAWKMVRGSIKGIHVPEDWFKAYDGLSADEMAPAMADAVIGADMGERTQKLVEKSASDGSDPMISVLLGSPDFQQQ